jgi:hypothetical protein
MSRLLTEEVELKWNKEVSVNTTLFVKKKTGNGTGTGSRNYTGNCGKRNYEKLLFIKYFHSYRKGY